ncbi:MAG TPA: hypothetical protein VMC79_13835 [Rectinemataceae bacterium]|nr:hypothetical protein [Rectinemataceae bacterium]
MDGNESLLAEALGLSAEGKDRGLRLLLMGGLAVRALCPTSRLPPYARVCGDADFFSASDGNSVERLFVSRGWKPDAEFNLYNGDSRLKFSHEELGKSADVFVRRFRMCHEIRIDAADGDGRPTVSLAELLLTKLQVVEANEKDLADAYCILADHDPVRGGTEGLDPARLAGACAADWGLFTTVQLSLERLEAWAAGSVPDESRAARVATGISLLRSALETEEKSLAWKARALVGKRLRWYELPEEVL